MSRHNVKLKSLPIVDVKRVWFHDVEGGGLVMGVVVGDSLQPDASLNHGAVLFPEVLLLLLLLLHLSLTLWNLRSERSGLSWDHSPRLLLLFPFCSRLFLCDLVYCSTSRQQLRLVMMIVMICFLLLLEVLSCFFLISDCHFGVAFVVDRF